ncbi:MAG: DNA translocase FtsK [Candidatus Paceibacterota bacterium]
MAKSKKKKERKNEVKGFFSSRSDAVQSAIGGVLIAAVTGFLILGAFGAAGVVGITLHGWLTTIFGASGYWIFIIGLGLIAYGLLRRSVSLPAITWIHGLAASVLFITILALISIATGGGGLIGQTVAAGAVAAFSVYAGVIVLEVIAVVSLLVIIDEYVDLTQPITLPGMSFMESGRDDAENVTVRRGSVEEQSEQDEARESKEKAEDKETRPSSSGDDQTDKRKDLKVDAYKKSRNPLGEMSTTITGDYTPPPVSLLSRDVGEPEVGDVKAQANLIKRTLENFNINVEMDEVSIGPTVTRYALKPAEGVRLNKITNLQNNLELALAAHPVRIEAPIPGKSLVGIEVPNTSKTTVGLAGLLGGKRFQDDPAPLLMALGQGISGNSFFADLNKMPHLLIGGATGSGKSVTIHALMNSLIFRNGPRALKLIMVDPKRVELTLYNGIPHLLTPVITSAKKAILALKWAAKEMDRRYDILEENGARDIKSYHETVLPKLEKKNKDNEPNPDPMPYIVIVIDEMADLMSAYPKELEAVVVRIAQMSRAVGIHLILSTQRPDVSIITGIIKANIPARIALQVSSQIDSRTILDAKGAESLLGAGDMLYQSGDMSKPVRIQSAFISENEVKKVVKFLKDQFADQLQDTVNLSKDNDEEGGGSKTIFDIAQEAEDEDDLDDKYDEALQTVVRAGKASTSYLQRKLRIGYSRAARIMDELEENGVISEKDGTNARNVLISKEMLESATGSMDNDYYDDPEADSDESDNGAGEDEEGDEYEDSTADSAGAEYENKDSSDNSYFPSGKAGRKGEEIDDKYFDALEEDPDTT